MIACGLDVHPDLHVVLLYPSISRLEFRNVRALLLVQTKVNGPNDEAEEELRSEKDEDGKFPR